MASDWPPDRGIRRLTLALAGAAAVLITSGALLELMWLLGIGVWAVMAALGIELIGSTAVGEDRRLVDRAAPIRRSCLVGRRACRGSRSAVAADRTRAVSPAQGLA
ncbi:hypothetical protein ACFVY9_26750 [Streptomyces sp. NPDC059544]|uniref:hypothetical protein n=1 Tax=Streptomyces sp. NPDC059544 TaxID=3346861 RepID=UPI0036C92F0E